jgi:hypothetical protein
MDHNETIRKFERLMIKQAEHAHSAGIEIEAMVSLLSDEKDTATCAGTGKGNPQTVEGFSCFGAKTQKQLTFAEVGARCASGEFGERLQPAWQS